MWIRSDSARSACGSPTLPRSGSDFRQRIELEVRKKTTVNPVFSEPMANLIGNVIGML